MSFQLYLSIANDLKTSSWYCCGRFFIKTMFYYNPHLLDIVNHHSICRFAMSKTKTRTPSLVSISPPSPPRPWMDCSTSAHFRLAITSSRRGMRPLGPRPRTSPLPQVGPPRFRSRSRHRKNCVPIWTGRVTLIRACARPA